MEEKEKEEKEKLHTKDKIIVMMKIKKNRIQVRSPCTAEDRGEEEELLTFIILK
jgi:hypothetical protein